MASEYLAPDNTRSWRAGKRGEPIWRTRADTEALPSASARHWISRGMRYAPGPGHQRALRRISAAAGVGSGHDEHKLGCPRRWLKSGDTRSVLHIFVDRFGLHRRGVDRAVGIGGDTFRRREFRVGHWRRRDVVVDLSRLRAADADAALAAGIVRVFARRIFCFGICNGWGIL